MRKKLVLGNFAAVALAVAVYVGMRAAGIGEVSALAATCVLLSILLTVHGLAVVNQFLGGLARIEEGAFRAALGDRGARIGTMEEPFDGLAYRVDQLVESLEAASPGEAGDTAGS